MSASTTTLDRRTLRCCRTSKVKPQRPSWSCRSSTPENGRHHQPGHDRQRIMLQIKSLQENLQAVQYSPSFHPTLQAADQRQGRTLHAPDQLHRSPAIIRELMAWFNRYTLFPINMIRACKMGFIRIRFWYCDTNVPMCSHRNGFHRVCVYRHRENHAPLC